MNYSKKWSKWIFSDSIKFIFFFLICIFIVYFSIEFSMNGSKILHSENSNIFKIIIYFYHHFIIYLNIFLCLALMFSIIKVIYSLNIHNELIALQMGGISIRKISVPIFTIAFFLTVISYINYEYLTPISTKSIEDYKNQSLKTKSNKQTNLVNTILLDNATKLIYQKFDTKTDNLVDVFWIKSKSDIWHMKYLTPNSSPSIGQYVDHFQKDKNGKFIKTESFTSYFFSDINFDRTANKSLQPYESRALSALLAQYWYNRFSSSVDRARGISQLNYKLAMPLLPLLLVFALIPFCTKFSRNNKALLISSLSLILFIGFHTVMDGALILSENRAGSPFFIIWTPIIICFSFFVTIFFRRK